MFDKLKKRRAYPVAGVEDTFVRLLTADEKKRLKDLDGDAKGWFYFGKILVKANGDQESPQTEGETDTDFIARMEAELADVDDGVLMLVRDAFAALSKGESIPVEDIAKN